MLLTSIDNDTIFYLINIYNIVCNAISLSDIKNEVRLLFQIAITWKTIVEKNSHLDYSFTYHNFYPQIQENTFKLYLFFIEDCEMI